MDVVVHVRLHTSSPKFYKISFSGSTLKIVRRIQFWYVSRLQIFMALKLQVAVFWIVGV